MRKWALIALLILCGSAAVAQDGYVLEVSGDSKTIYVDRLNMPRTCTIAELLCVLPEILGRPSVSQYENYDVQVNGFSLGMSAASILEQTTLANVEKITISESAVSSFQNNGQGGSINVTMKTPAEGFAGSADLGLSTITDIMPLAQAACTKGKWSVYALVAAENFHPADYEVSEYNHEPPGSTTNNITKNLSGNEMARFYIRFRPTDKDELNFRASQSYTKKLNYILQEDSSFTTSRDESSTDLDVTANVKYTHTFTPGSSIKAELNFSHNPTSSNSASPSTRDIDNSMKRGTLSGKVEYGTSLLKTDSPQRLNLTLGVNGNGSTNRNVSEETMHIFGLSRYPHNVYTTGSTVFVSPYTKLSFSTKQLKIDLSAEYQHYMYSNKADGGKPFKTNQKSFTGKIITGWQITEHQHLRLILDRKLKRPSVAQLYPYVLYNFGGKNYYKGNPDLAPIIVREVGLDYIVDTKTTSGGTLIMNAGVNYIHANSVIYVRDGGPDPNSDFPYAYKTYENAGFNDVINGNLMLYYKKGIFTANICGNIYSNNEWNGFTKDHYTYYSISAISALNFKYNWALAGEVIFHSPVTTLSSTLGGSSTIMLRLSKGWNRFSADLMGRMPIPSHVTDIKESGKYVISTTYIPDYTYLALGLHFSF